MTREIRRADPPNVFCETCAKPIRKSEALSSEGRDFSAYFCGPDCYERGLAASAPQQSPQDAQEGSGRSKSRDDRLKRIIKQHPQRDEPRADSVGVEDLPR